MMPSIIMESSISLFAQEFLRVRQRREFRQMISVDLIPTGGPGERTLSSSPFPQIRLGVRSVVLRQRLRDPAPADACWPSAARASAAPADDAPSRRAPGFQRHPHPRPLSKVALDHRQRRAAASCARPPSRRDRSGRRTVLVPQVQPTTTSIPRSIRCFFDNRSTFLLSFFTARHPFVFSKEDFWGLPSSTTVRGEARGGEFGSPW